VNFYKLIAEERVKNNKEVSVASKMVNQRVLRQCLGLLMWFGVFAFVSAQGDVTGFESTMKTANAEIFKWAKIILQSGLFL